MKMQIIKLGLFVLTACAMLSLPSKAQNITGTGYIISGNGNYATPGIYAGEIGQSNTTSGTCSYGFGNGNNVSGAYSIAEGYYNTASK